MEDTSNVSSGGQALKRKKFPGEGTTDEQVRRLSTDIVDVAALNSFTIPKAKKKKGINVLNI